MNNNLFNQLSLAYSPLSSYDFAMLKNDQAIKRAIEHSTFYIIARRPVLYFNKVSVDKKSWSLIFEIHQNENSEILFCKIPLDQENLFDVYDNPISLRFWYNDEKYAVEGPVKNKVSGIQLYSGKDFTNFRLWLTPEKFLKHYDSGSLEATIEGNYINFRKYEVLYVGKATEQSILKRLSNHSKLQEILSVENNISDGELIKDETVLLLFELTPELLTRTYATKEDLKHFIPILKGELPSQNKITSDAEKAFIKLMSPKYNSIQYKKYPEGSDGLYEDKYDHILYYIKDEIQLAYSNSIIRGGIEKSQIIIKEQKELIIK